MKSGGKEGLYISLFLFQKQDAVLHCDWLVSSWPCLWPELYWGLQYVFYLLQVKRCSDINTSVYFNTSGLIIMSIKKHQICTCKDFFMLQLLTLPAWLVSVRFVLL